MKEVFQLEKSRVDWLAEMVANPKFKEAKVFAIAQHARNLGSDPGDALRLKGGVEIFTILESLPKTERKPDEQAKLIR